ncbi:IS66-like element accessory protein TnpA [Methylocapsa palsarum]|uniref:Transposase n=1 Tax=Methylocapsa palsarum TaxID=1612308 RepID=A0A1I3WXG6_9HYPH|nr:transposase [Methylocapsa palsarum]SFK12114.1 transposase [Methylocapsa palsarum]
MLHLRNSAFLPSQVSPRGLTSLPAPSPRSGKRRVFTAEQKARIVEESFVSGQSVCTVARRHGLMAAQLFAWRKNARLRAEEDRMTESAAEPLSLEFNPYFESDDHPPLQETAPIEISIGSVVVRVPPGFDVETLKAVLEVVSAAS